MIKIDLSFEQSSSVAGSGPHNSHQMYSEKIGPLHHRNSPIVLVYDVDVVLNS